jgi:hypothetical protein
MNRIAPAMLLTCVALLVSETAQAGWGVRRHYGSHAGARAAAVAQTTCWHRPYYYVPWGTTTALVVPPKVETQTHWGWGVGSTRVTPIHHQFQRDWPGTGAGSSGPMRPTPPWPSNTDQFGVYYVRGPW